MNSVWPCSSTQTPRSGVFSARSNTALRNLVPSGVRMNCARNASGAGVIGLTGRLLQDGAELHGEAHIAGDLELALHEGRSAVEFALHHFVEGVERPRNRTVGGLDFTVTDRIGL